MGYFSNNLSFMHTYTHIYIDFQTVLQMCSDISGLCYSGNTTKYVPDSEANLKE